MSDESQFPLYQYLCCTSQYWLGVSFAMQRYVLYCLYEGLSQTMSDTICIYKSEEANWCVEVNVRGRIGTLESYVVVWCYYWKRVAWDAIK